MAYILTCKQYAGARCLTDRQTQPQVTSIASPRGSSAFERRAQKTGDSDSLLGPVLEGLETFL